MEGHASRATDLIRIGLVALSALAGRLGASEPLFEFDVFSLLSALLGGYPILQEAAKALWRRRMTMELSMSIAVLAAIAIGQYFTAAIIVLFVLGAEVLEDMTVSRGNRALSDLVPLLPDTALLRDRAGTRKVPVSQSGRETRSRSGREAASRWTAKSRRGTRSWIRRPSPANPFRSRKCPEPSFTPGRSPTWPESPPTSSSSATTSSPLPRPWVSR